VDDLIAAMQVAQAIVGERPPSLSFALLLDKHNQQFVILATAGINRPSAKLPQPVKGTDSRCRDLSLAMLFDLPESG